MAEVGYASLGIIPSFKGFGRELESGTSKHMAAAGAVGGAQFGDAASRSASSRFGSAMRRLGKVAALGLAGGAAGVIKLGADSVSLASDLNESLNAVNVTYGKQSKAVKRLGKQAADSLGLSNSEFNALAVRFSAFSKTISGGDSKKVVSTLDDLTTRAADFASVMNLEVNEAAELFQSGLAGETEPLRKYGLDLSAAAVEAYALSEGIVKSKDDLDESAKVQARYALLMDKTSKASGDFANTSDSLANRQRILNARWDDARAKLGTALLPAMEDISGWVLDKGIPAFERFGDWFVEDGIPAIKDFGGFLKDDVLPPLKRAGEFAGDLIGWLKDLPGPAKIAALTAALGGMGALKLRGGTGGALGTAGKVLGMTKPVPVFVTNKGFGGSGVGAAAGKGGFVATAGKFGMVGLVAAAAYAMYKMPDIWNFGAKKLGEGLGLDKKGDKPGSAGTDEHKKMLAGWQGAEGGVNKYNESLERTRDHLLTVTNGVTGFSSKSEQARDKVLAVTNGIVDFGEKGKHAGDKASTSLRGVGSEADKARAKVRLLGAELDWATRSREARITITQRYARAGYQTVGGLQETTGGAGVTVNIDRVEAHDYDDFMTQTQRRAHRAALEGRR